MHFTLIKNPFIILYILCIHVNYFIATPRIRFTVQW